MPIRKSDSREALTAANDVVTLLRVAADTAQLVRERVHGDTYVQTDELLRAITGLHRRAEELERQVAAYVTERDRSR
jgi:hypothetical protein